jgi:hygromycin-B 4-O-kinase
MIKPEFTAIARLILEKNYQSNELVRTLIPLKSGEWSAAHRFSFGGQDFVIRVSHTSDNFYRDSIAAGWSSPNLPIPKIIKIDRYQEHYYAISPFFHGEAFESLSAADLEQTIPNFLSMMTALRSVNLDSVTRFGTLTPAGNGAFHSWSEALLDVNNDRPDSLIHGWKKTLSETPEAQRKYDQFYERLTELVRYCPEHKRLIHSDLLYNNLLVDNNKISAVLDWGCAMIGVLVYDIAIFAFFEPWYPAFTQVNLIEKMQQSFLDQSSDNRQNFNQRMIACQIHLTLGNIAYCVLSEGKFDFWEHINRLDDVLKKANLIYFAE